MYLVFEVGGTNTKIGFSNGEDVSDTQIISTPENFEEFLNQLKQIADKKGEIKAVSGGIPVVFDKNLNITRCAHLPNWIGKNAKEELEKVFNTPIFLDNETSLSGLAEAVKGAGLGYSIVAYVTIGTGVGTARIVDGKLDKKAFGFEAGHQIIIPDGDACSCGGKGHLETYVGGSYLEKKYNKKPQNLTDEKIWYEVSKYLGIGLYNITVHWSPDIIILGGSVSKSVPLEKVKDHLKDFCKIFPQIPDLKLSQLGEQSGLLGALEIIHKP